MLTELINTIKNAITGDSPQSLGLNTGTGIISTLITLILGKIFDRFDLENLKI